MDIVLYENSMEGIRLLYSDNGEYFAKYDTLDSINYLHKLKPANINNDGYIDMVYIEFYGGESGWIENIDGLNFIKHPINFNGEVYNIFPIDIDNDSLDELLIPHNKKLFVIDNISENYFISEEYNYGHVSDGVIFDIDYDSDLDFISYSRVNQECVWLENTHINASVYYNIETPLILYPNPATTQLFISTKNQTPINEITIYNQLGQKVLHSSYISGAINVSILSQGMYVVEVISDEFRVREKLVIKK